MNQKTTYELTITGKLQQLPLPDREDAIWARIKTQLDRDMPTDDDGGNTPDAPSGGGWFWGAGIFLVVAALITAFLLTNKPTPNVQPAPLKTIQTNTPSATVEKNSEPPPQTLPFNSSSSPPVPTIGRSPLATDPITAPLTGAVSAQPTVSLPMPDSVRQTTFMAPPPVALDTTATKKKARGVTGITDNDYRIVPQKDSM
jgi:hypothetical protein